MALVPGLPFEEKKFKHKEKGDTVGFTKVVFLPAYN